MLNKAREVEEGIVREDGTEYAITEVIRELEGEMAEAASKLEFERAALLRDQINELKKQAGLAPDKPTVHKGTRKSTTYPKGTGKRRK